MSKSKKIYVCSNCGTESAKWIGKCNNCGEWNTYKEFNTNSGKKTFGFSDSESTEPVKLDEISTANYKRIVTSYKEFNRVLGGGIVPGSAILIGGDPGIGKSTLVLQIALELNSKVLYVTGEESAAQIKGRADRVKGKSSECYVFNETNVEDITNNFERIKPSILIIDSIQTIYKNEIESSPGSVSQIKDSAFSIIKTAKKLSIPVILIGHITKEGSIAGPKILEHMVDVVLQFEGDKSYYYRILRSVKNRYGANSEIAVFEMQEKGLLEILDTSNLFFDKESNGKYSGTSISCVMEGIKPFLVEIQTLVGPAVYGNPQRTANGLNVKRLNMLLAVLEKKANVKLSDKDVYVNVTGGLKIDDPGMDLSIIASLLSSVADIPIPHDYCFIGETGLTGAVRAVSQMQKRVDEALKLGFKKVYTPLGKFTENLKTDDLVFISDINSLKKLLFA